MSEYNLKVKIICDNEAFGEGNLEHEIHRIIREQVLGFIGPGMKHLFDVNGNIVGTATVDIDEETL